MNSLFLSECSDAHEVVSSNSKGQARARNPHAQVDIIIPNTHCKKKMMNSSTALQLDWLIEREKFSVVLSSFQSTVQNRSRNGISLEFNFLKMTALGAICYVGICSYLNLGKTLQHQIHVLEINLHDSTSFFIILAIMDDALLAIVVRATIFLHQHRKTTCLLRRKRNIVGRS